MCVKTAILGVCLVGIALPAAADPNARLPRIELSCAGNDVHIPLVERLGRLVRYGSINQRVLRVARQVALGCPNPGASLQLSDGHCTALGIPSSPAQPLDRRCKLRLASVVAAASKMVPVEWSADVAATRSGALCYVLTRGTCEVGLLDGKRGLTAVAPIAHNHLHGAAEPSFGDLQNMSTVRQQAKALGLTPVNDEIIVVNQPGKDRFQLIRYEHAFRN